MLAIPITHVLFYVHQVWQTCSMDVFCMQTLLIDSLGVQMLLLLGQARMMCNFFSQPHWSLGDDTTILFIS
jgi:hypothetical protein